MDHIRILERPNLKNPWWVGAFVGWADAQEGATQAIRYLVRKLRATKFAEIDPEEFYDFTSVRPIVYYDDKDVRRLRWPANEFYYWQSPDQSRELVLFLGTEPSLKWRTYSQALLQVAQGFDLRLIITLGALLDALPHTREPGVSGTAGSDNLKLKIEGLPIRRSAYEGPVGITSAFMDACSQAKLEYLSLWGHAPHYVQQSPNFKVTRSLVAQLNRLLELEVPLGELEEKGRAFEAEVTKAIASSVEVSAYVKRLERQYDAQHPANALPADTLPDPESLVKDVEAFLREDKGKPQG